MPRRREDFPMSWEMWQDGVRNAYALKDELEAKLERGETLTEDESKWLEPVRSVVATYKRNGRKRRR